MADSYDVPAGDKIQVKLSDGTPVSLNDFLNNENLTEDDQQLQEALQMYATSTVGNKQLQEIANNYDTLFKGEGELCITAGSLDNLYGEYNKANNTLTIDIAQHGMSANGSPTIKTINIAKTLAHELTHAQDDNDLENAGDDKGTEQFAQVNLATETRAKLREIKMEIELFESNSCDPQALSSFAAQYKKDKEELQDEGEANQRFFGYLNTAKPDELPRAIRDDVLTWRKTYHEQAGLTASQEGTAEEQNFFVKLVAVIVSIIRAIFGGGEDPNVSETLQNTPRGEGKPPPASSPSRER